MAPTMSLNSFSILHVRSLEDSDAAYALDTRLRLIDWGYRRSFVERGLILLEVEERQLWKLMLRLDNGEAYTSLNSWICDAAPYSRSDSFAALRAVKELRDIPTDMLLEMPRVNVQVLQALSSQVRQDEGVLEAARTHSKKDFVAMIERDHPQQHIKEDAYEDPDVELAIKMAQALEDGCDSRRDALKCIAIAYIQEMQLRYDEHMGDL